VSDFASVYTDLVGAFDAAWAIAEPDVDVLHDNEPRFDPPKNPKSGEEWARFRVLHGQGALPEIGSDTSESGGRVVVEIHVGLGRGVARSNAMASKVRDIFQGKRIGGVRCYESEEVVIGADSGNIWFQVNVSTRFRFESTPV